MKVQGLWWRVEGEPGLAEVGIDGLGLALDAAEPGADHGLGLVKDKCIRPAITFVIFASGLRYAGPGTTALGWTLCAVILSPLPGGWPASAPGGPPVPRPVADTIVVERRSTVTGLD